MHSLEGKMERIATHTRNLKELERVNGGGTLGVAWSRVVCGVEGSEGRKSDQIAGSSVCEFYVSSLNRNRPDLADSRNTVSEEVESSPTVSASFCLCIQARQKHRTGRTLLHQRRSSQPKALAPELQDPLRL